MTTLASPYQTLADLYGDHASRSDHRRAAVRLVKICRDRGDDFVTATAHFSAQAAYYLTRALDPDYNRNGGSRYGATICALDHLAAYRLAERCARITLLGGAA